MGSACFVVLLSLLALWFFWRALLAPVRNRLLVFPERAGEPGPVELRMAVAFYVLIGLYLLKLAWAWVEEVWSCHRASGVGKRGLVLFLTICGAGKGVMPVRCCWGARLLLLRAGVALRSENGYTPESVFPAALVLILLAHLVAVLRRTFPSLDAFLARPAAEAAVTVGLFFAAVVFGFAVTGTGWRPRRRSFRC